MLTQYSLDTTLASKCLVWWSAIVVSKNDTVVSIGNSTSNSDKGRKKSRQ